MMTQLRMEKRGLDDIPDLPAPQGYLLRTFRWGDECALARIYADSKLDKGTVEEVRRDVLDDPCFVPERLFVAVWDGEVVGTASAWVTDYEPDVGYLHMLGVLSEHRGNGLGAALVAAALRYTREEGYTAQRLLTDDWREPAIRLYLRLGYDPLLCDASHEERWRRLAESIGDPSIAARMRPFVPVGGNGLMRRLRRFIRFAILVRRGPRGSRLLF